MLARIVSPVSSISARISRLSGRQRTCLDLAAEGLTSAGIGKRLGVSPRTVDEHIALACQLLGVRTRIQAVAVLASDAARAGEPRSFLP